ncbi:hypothetical protein K2X30_07665 [bacterium]|nr:hypothetical protein [bacterium]
MKKSVLLILLAFISSITVHAAPSRSSSSPGGGKTRWGINVGGNYPLLRPEGAQVQFGLPVVGLHLDRRLSNRFGLQVFAEYGKLGSGASSYDFAVLFRWGNRTYVGAGAQFQLYSVLPESGIKSQWNLPLSFGHHFTPKFFLDLRSTTGFSDMFTSSVIGTAQLGYHFN